MSRNHFHELSLCILDALTELRFESPLRHVVVDVKDLAGQLTPIKLDQMKEVVLEMTLNRGDSPCVPPSHRRWGRRGDNSTRFAIVLKETNGGG